MRPRDIVRRVLRPEPRSPGLASAPAPPSATSRKPTDEESLGRELLQLDSGLGLFRWVHLADALDRSPDVAHVLSVGSGGGLHEAFLGRTRTRLDVTGVDLNEPWVDRDLPNLRFLKGDLLEPAFRTSLPKADFCYSIECLEHIEDDWAVVRAMADLLAPGGFLYLQVPFASPAEQRDAELCAAERLNHGHVRPGYDGEGMGAFARKLGLEVVLVAGAFWSPLQPIIFAAVEKFGSALAPQWQAILDLARLDLRTGVPANRAEATAIKMLARKPA